MKLVPCPCCRKPTEPETLCEACCEKEADAWLEALTKPAFARALTDDLLSKVASELGAESIPEDAAMEAMMAVAS